MITYNFSQDVKITLSQMLLLSVKVLASVSYWTLIKHNLMRNHLYVTFETINIRVE